MILYPPHIFPKLKNAKCCIGLRSIFLFRKLFTFSISVYTSKVQVLLQKNMNIALLKFKTLGRM